MVWGQQVHSHACTHSISYSCDLFIQTQWQKLAFRSVTVFSARRNNCFMAVINKEFICVSEEAVPPLDFTGSPIYMQRLFGFRNRTAVWCLVSAWLITHKLAGDTELRQKLLVNSSEPCFYLQTWNNIPYCCLCWMFCGKKNVFCIRIGNVSMGSARHVSSWDSTMYGGKQISGW